MAPSVLRLLVHPEPSLGHRGSRWNPKSSLRRIAYYSCACWDAFCHQRHDRSNRRNGRAFQQGHPGWICCKMKCLVEGGSSTCKCIVFKPALTMLCRVWAPLVYVIFFFHTLYPATCSLCTGAAGIWASASHGGIGVWRSLNGSSACSKLFWWSLRFSRKELAEWLEVCG